MLSQNTLKDILDEYVQDVIPAMQRRQYHLILAKGGPEYAHLSEQSMLAHVVNGVFALARLIRFVIEKNIFVVGLNKQTLRKAFALFPVHDNHKLGNFDPMGRSEFSIPLERLREEYTKLGLDQFAEIDAHLMRAANVSKRSPYQGDLTLADEKASLLWLLVRLADTMASTTSPREIGTLAGYLKQLAPEFASKGNGFCLYFHEIRDVRGVLTNLTHSAVARQLETEYGFYPLLFYATGTLYLGPTRLPKFDRSTFVENVVKNVLGGMIGQGSQEAKTFVQEGGIRREKYDFQPHIHAIADAPLLLDIVLEETLSAKPRTGEDRQTHQWKFGKDQLEGIGRLKVNKEQQEKKQEKKDSDFRSAPSKGIPGKDWQAKAEKRLGICLSKSKEFNFCWWQAHRYLLYVDSLLRDLAPAQNRLEWFLLEFNIPEGVAGVLGSDQDIWSKGGLGKYVFVVAYHFLKKGTDFADRPAEQRPPTEVLDLLHQRILKAFAKLDIQAGRKDIMTNLGFSQELADYLHEHLSCSWAPESQLQEDVFTSYLRPKRKGHSDRVCSICNRASQQGQEIRTGVLGDFGRVFSNRVLPAQEAPGKNRPWCPICHLEFILRQLVGLSLPPRADYTKSYRIYLYVLPTFSFTTEHIRLFKDVLEEFRKVSGLAVRDFGQTAPGLPRTWLDRRELDPEWMNDVVDGFTREAKRIAQYGGQGYIGDRLSTGRIPPQPHYYLLTWERLVREKEKDDALIPTRSEAWSKALLAALVISSLTSMKVHVSEHPYLPVFDPADLKATITLDGAPPILRGFLEKRTDSVSLYGREEGPRSELEQALDMVSALWTITAEVHSPNRQNKDKQIAARLNLANVQPLAGATFYKEYSRLNDDQSPVSTLTRACEVLLEYRGGETMDLVKQIVDESLRIRLPFRGKARGKAYSYELVFREAVAAMRKAFLVIPELKTSALTGEKPSEECVAELKKLASGTLLKAMERRQQSQGRGDGYINPPYKDEERQNLGLLTGNFVALVVDGVFLERANGSFARFLNLENSIADGVFYVTDRVIGEKWESCQAARKEKTGISATA